MKHIFSIRFFEFKFSTKSFFSLQDENKNYSDKE